MRIRTLLIFAVSLHFSVTVLARRRGQPADTDGANRPTLAADETEKQILSVLEDLNQNNDGAAINSLEAFINAVKAQIGKSLEDAQADALIDAAQAIINNLSMP